MSNKDNGEIRAERVVEADSSIWDESSDESSGDAVDQIIAGIEDELRKSGHPDPTTVNLDGGGMEEEIDKAVPKGVSSQSTKSYAMFCTTKLCLGESVDDPAAFDTETNSVHIITARDTNDAIMLAKFHLPAGILAQEDLENLTWKSINGEVGPFQLLRKDGSRDWDIAMAAISQESINDAIRTLIETCQEGEESDG